MNCNNQSSDSSSSSRFSLILLEPGEIYFEDYLVYYHQFKCPFVNNENLPTQQPKIPSNISSQNNFINQGSHINFNNPVSLEFNNVTKLKGNLKICSKSIVFDPINLSSPLLKFPLKAIEQIEQFDSNSTSTSKHVDGIYSDIYSLKFNPTDQQKQDQTIQHLKKKCFALHAKQVVQCKPNNKISPYVTKKRENTNDKHYFQFIFTDVNDSLDLMRQLHRASTLDFEHEDLMLQMILKSRLSRQVKFDLNLLDDMFKEQIQFESEVNKINPLVANPGKIILSNMCLYYKPFNNLDNEKQILKIKLKKIKYVIKRRYHLKKVGCEIVFDENMSDGDSNLDTRQLPYLYLTFEDEQMRDEFYSRLLDNQKDKLVNLENFTQENMLQKWRYGTISNFEYLMYLNNMADRSYNDLTQYPVFPWVLSDYTSATLDLTENKVYRDLSKPIGALNEERISRLRKRCREMQEATTGFNGNKNYIENKQPMFLYGTHYSTPAFVSFFLVRQMPEWQLCLQNGRFDHPNRLFHNISDTWRNCLQSDSDVKELIPEFYDISSDSNSFENQLGSFLQNKLELDLGVRQDSVRVNDVILPRWAKNDPTTFVKKMREALESNYVSENLHKWIDLIFGYKQLGDEALKADNLFYYLCYEGAVDLESIKNYSQRKSLEIQIQEFGQIPTQLFQQPHLQRVKYDLSISPKLDPETLLQLENVKICHERQKPLQQNNNSQINSEEKEIESDAYAQFKINATNFNILTVKLEIKLHKDQVNDLLFIDKKRTSSEKHFRLPLVCSVSNDNWLKIYSMEEKSLFRSYNVSNFSLSSVSYIQVSNNQKSDEETSPDDCSDADQICRTLLFLSCWDNGMYVYDMNYNRCVFSLESSHDDAVSRVRVLGAQVDISTKSEIQLQAEKYKIILTSSWDSLIKIWILPLKQQQQNSQRNSLQPDSMIYTDSIKAKFLYELAFESSVVDFQVGNFFLASICDDGNLYIWNFDPKKIIAKYEKSQLQNINIVDAEEYKHYYDRFAEEDNEDINTGDTYYTADNACFGFLNSIQSSYEIGKIVDCKIVEQQMPKTSSIDKISSPSSIAVCTSNGYIKIYNIQTSVEIFSIRLYVPESNQTICSQLNKLYYSSDYIITVCSQGYVYFMDLKQVNTNTETGSNNSMSNNTGNITSSSFLSHTIRLTSNQLQSLCIYKERIICVGDSSGKVYFLSLMNI